MNRTFLLVSGVLLWVVAGADALAHLLVGDLLVPGVMAAVLVLWVGLRLVPARLVQATAAVADPS